MLFWKINTDDKPSVNILQTCEGAIGILLWDSEDSFQKGSVGKSDGREEKCFSMITVWYSKPSRINIEWKVPSWRVPSVSATLKNPMRMFIGLFLYLGVCTLCFVLLYWIQSESEDIPGRARIDKRLSLNWNILAGKGILTLRVQFHLFK